MSKEEDKQQRLDMVLQKLNKQHGAGTVGLFNDFPDMTIDVISTGSLGVDHALGVGGLAKGRIIEIYGPEACVVGDSFLQYEVRLQDGRRINHKGGTIKRLWERFHGEPAEGDGRGKYLRPAAVGAEFFAPSVNEEDRIFQNRVTDVVRVGDREVFEICTLGGRSLTATADHRFFDGTKYIRLGDLNPGDTVLMHENVPFRKEEKSSPVSRRKYLYVKHHPVAGTKMVLEYAYKRLLQSRAVAEAAMNDLTLDNYISRLNEGALDGLRFLAREDHVHHLDEDESNDSLDNLAVINASEHCRLHAQERHNNLRYVAVEDVVSSIVPRGIQEVFDLKMESPFNNYVVNNFVTHNSGKTTLTLHAISECQKAGGIAAFIDAEHALDPTYAEALGVDLSRLVLSQPDSGEQALNIAEELVESGAIDMIVIDSVAALVPQAEIDGEVGDHHVGTQARMMSQALRKVKGHVNNNNVCFILINQLRQKIGLVFGSNEVTTGGKSLAFYASQRIDIRRNKAIKDGEEVIGNRTRVKIVKNKVAPPARVVEFDIRYGKGINKAGEVVDAALLLHILEKAGAWYKYNDETVAQGRDQAIEWLETHPDIYKTIESNVRKQLGLLR